MKKLSLYFLILISFTTAAFDEFLITDIRIVGLQRVSIGSIFTSIPVSVGDKMNQGKVSEITRALFSTAQFNDNQILSIEKSNINEEFELRSYQNFI
jgi:outer membrane protein insertion porin family